MYWYLVLVLAISQYSDAFPTEPKSNKPSFCRGLECPAYKVMMKTADFEERCYAEYKWASTDISGNAVFTSEPTNTKFFAFLTPRVSDDIFLRLSFGMYEFNSIKLLQDVLLPKRRYK